MGGGAFCLGGDELRYVSCSIGDAGGYMGLLIGASCLTLCEVLDLFLYNGLLKLMNKTKRRRVDSVVDIIEGNAAIDETNYQTERFTGALPTISDWISIIKYMWSNALHVLTPDLRLISSMLSRH